jgi:uncharacterized protein YciI
MDKQYFFLKLNPARPDFAQTMNADEQQIMLQHVDYWKDLMAKGKVVVFGPVFDPKAVYGIGVICAESEDEVKEFIAKDPATEINIYEYYAMRAVLPEHL